MRLFSILSIAVVTVLVISYFYARGESVVEGEVVMSEILASDTTGYKRALGPRELVFPEDHGPHPDFKLEWWYYTGNLMSDDGRPFGYQFTIFRNALAPPSGETLRTSEWATRQLYLAHFAISDIEEEVFYHAERFSRGSAGLAGAQASPFSVWLEDWQIEETEDGMPAMRIAAQENDFSIDIELNPLKPIILQGDRGFSRKGEGDGNASYYYSMTRLATKGRVQIGEESFPVSGLSWMDREWSTSMLAEGQVGWDWFSLQLSDGRDVMYFQVRTTRPGDRAYTAGTLVEPDGQKVDVDLQQVVLEVTESWTNDQGDSYPAGWQLSMPAEQLQLKLTPRMPDQEMDTAVRYWEGSIRVEGQSKGVPVQGYGYAELTGYASEGSAFLTSN